MSKSKDAAYDRWLETSDYTIQVDDLSSPDLIPVTSLPGDTLRSYLTIRRNLRAHGMPLRKAWLKKGKNE